MKQKELGMVLAGVLALVGCEKAEDAARETTAAAPAPAQVTAKADAKPEVVEIQQAAALFAAHAVPVDANGQETREEYGVIPGAKLLSSSSGYDCAAELPADKNTPLVFYCGNEHCTASDTAAGRALANGYQQVKILRAGIIGWKESGQKTVPPAS